MPSEGIKFLLEYFIEQQEAVEEQLREKAKEKEEEDEIFETEYTDYVYTTVEEERNHRIPNFDDWD
jgi:hypothetical protein